MRIMKKINILLKRTSGASLILVLGIMLFLMAIGVSTMSAAFANAGYIMRQNDFNRVKLLHESIHENIMFSMQDRPGYPNSLGYRIAMAIFDANDPRTYAPGVPVSPLGSIDLDILISNTAAPGTSILRNNTFGNIIAVESITLSFPEQFVSIQEAIPPVSPFPLGATGDEVITPARPREPRTASLNASMIVEVVISSGDRTITSTAFYEYTGGRLTDNPSSTPVYIDPPSPPDMKLIPAPSNPPYDPGGYVIWRMVRHEIIDW